MAIHFKLPGVFEDTFLCNIPKTSAFAALLGTGKPIFTIGITYIEKMAFQFLRYFVVHTTNQLISPPKTLDNAKFTLRVVQYLQYFRT